MIQLTTYEDVVRHLDKFPKEKLYISRIDSPTEKVVNVKFSGKGLEVLTTKGEWIPVKFVLSNMKLEDFVSKKKKIKRKKKETPKPIPASEIGKNRAWI